MNSFFALCHRLSEPGRRIHSSKCSSNFSSPVMSHILCFSISWASNFVPTFRPCFRASFRSGPMHGISYLFLKCEPHAFYHADCANGLILLHYFAKFFHYLFIMFT